MPIDKQKVSAAAQKYIQRGAYDKAIRELGKLVEADPGDVRTLLKIGNLHSRKGETDQAVEVYLNVAQHYKASGFYQKAVAVFKQIVQLCPDRIDVAEALGTLYCAQGLTKDALTQYRSVLQRYVEANDPAGVGRSLGVMVQVDPDNNGLRVTYAEHLAKNRQLDAAAHQFSIALQRLRHLGQDDEFVRVAERLLYHQPDSLQTLKDLSGCYLRQNKARQALSKLQSLYQLNQQDTETLELLVQAFGALGQTSKAVDVLIELARVYEFVDPHGALPEQTWRRALSMSPHEPSVIAGLSKYNVMELDDSALEFVDDDIIAESLPDIPADLRTTATALHEQGSLNGELERLLAECDASLKYNLLDKAYGHVQAILTMYPGHISARERLVEIYQKSQQPAYAAQVLRDLTVTCWSSSREVAKEYLALALELEGESRANTDLLASFSLTPAQLHRAPAPPPTPQIGLDLDLDLGLSLDATDLLAPASAKANTQRQVYATLPPDAFEMVEEDEEESANITSLVPALLPELAPAPIDDEPMFELAGLDAILNLDQHEAAPASTTADDEFEGLFDIDGSDIDDLFSSDLLTGDFTVPDADAYELQAQEGYFGNAKPVNSISEGDLEVLLEDLAEADFYTAQGLYNEASSMLEDLRGRFGDHPLITAARIRLDERSAGR